jgi:hypothetical protein
LKPPAIPANPNFMKLPTPHPRTAGFFVRVSCQQRWQAASLLTPAWQELTRIETELATAETDTNVIELHPQAVRRFKENVEALADILVTKDALPDLELMGTFRSLVESVVVRLSKAGGRL